MIIFLLSIIIIVVISLQSNDSKIVFSSDQTTALKGIGIIVVFFDHINGYFRKLMGGGNFSSLIDSIPVNLVDYSTQLFVGLFLFTSGFGVFQSIKKKGIDYCNNMPQNRILPTLLNFDIAVIGFMILNVILQLPMNLKQLALSFVAWDSIGNSNWYIFAILICYICVYLTSRFVNLYSRYLPSLGLLLFFYFIIMIFTKEAWWYTTIFCFLLGSIYSVYQNSINTTIEAHYSKFAILIIFLFILSFVICRIPVLYNIPACLFCIICVTFSIKWSIKNKLLTWCGKHLFPLYIYQRIPMILLYTLYPSIMKNHYCISIVVCFATTCLIANYIPLVKSIAWKKSNN